MHFLYIKIKKIRFIILKKQILLFKNVWRRF